MLNVAIEAARQAGRIQREGFDKRHEVRRKGAIDLVTEVDVACEEAIRVTLERLTPGVGILGEEEGQTGGTKTRWIVDPLDGTTNFAHGLPIFCSVIALEVDGELTTGAIYDPMRDELFTAERTKGAKLNGATMMVSESELLGDSLLVTGFPYDNRENPRKIFEAFAHMTRMTRGVRRLGSAALDLAYVAAGRLDGFWEVGLNPWDIGAGGLLVEEAGGKVATMGLDVFDHLQPDIIAANPAIFTQLERELIPLLID